MTDHAQLSCEQLPPDPAGGEQPDSEQDRALDEALARLDGLEALGVHEHVEVYTAVDAALRRRLAGAED
ncbi:hypothetical protein [Kineococcus sp. SYSU DK003]|uniref:hypothetical protein n=1 Tax=Kineococcus sp. SYSU DK003 TaxID=3383124 RepID=UPI003D7EDEAD